MIGDDPRFVVSRCGAAAGLLPQLRARAAARAGEAELIALCDQDDRWQPEKLAVLRRRSAAPRWSTPTSGWSTRTAACCATRCGRDGATTTPTSPRCSSANTITGAATLFRREVAELALPFPERPGAAVPRPLDRARGARRGDVAYVDRPLYDYVQHGGAFFGDVRRRPGRAARRCCAGGAAPTSSATRPRCAGAALLVRCGARLTPRKRRALTRFVARRALAAGVRLAGAAPAARGVGARDARQRVGAGARDRLALGVALLALGARRPGGGRSTRASPTHAQLPAARACAAGGASCERRVRFGAMAAERAAAGGDRGARASRRRSASRSTASTRSRSARCTRSRAATTASCTRCAASRSTSTAASSSASSAATAPARARC